MLALTKTQKACKGMNESTDITTHTHTHIVRNNTVLTMSYVLMYIILKLLWVHKIAPTYYL